MDIMRKYGTPEQIFFSQSAVESIYTTKKFDPTNLDIPRYMITELNSVASVIPVCIQFKANLTINPL